MTATITIKKKKKPQINVSPYSQNRKTRRANEARKRKSAGNEKKRNIALSKINASEKRKKIVLKKVQENREKTAKRLALRKEIAKKEGVNYKRVALIGRKGKLGESYVIRKIKG